MRSAPRPETINIKHHIEAETEYGLVSGDRLDVMIKTTKETWAIEVKSKISEEHDILRGIYQCVKYQAVLNAEKIIEQNGTEIKTLLVLEGKMPYHLKIVADYLNVRYVDNFEITLY